MFFQRIGFTILLFFLATVSPLISFPLVVKIPQVLAQSQNILILKTEAEQLQQQGIEKLNSGQAEAAIDPLQQALNIYRKINDRNGEGQTLKNLGNAYYTLSNYNQAINSSQKALILAREINDYDLESRILLNLGNIHREQQQQQKAIDYYQQSLIVARTYKIQEVQGLALGNLGIAYYHLGDYSKAIDDLQSALKIARSVGDRKLESMTLVYLGQIYSSLNKYTEAVEYFQQALLITRQLNNRRGEGAVAGGLALAYEQQENYEKAAEFYELMLTVAQEFNDRGTELEARRSLERVQHRFEQQSPEPAGQQLDLLAQGRSLYELGSLSIEQDNYIQAIENFQQSLEIARKVNNPVLQAQSLQSLGITYFGLGDFDKAMKYARQTLEVTNKFDKDQKSQQSLSTVELRFIRQLHGEALSLLGSAYLFGDADADQAIKYFQDSLNITASDPSISPNPENLSSLGLAYMVKGNYDKAIYFYEEALSVHRSIKNDFQFENINRQIEGIYLRFLGWAYASKGEYQKAIKYSRKSLNIAQEDKNLIGKAGALGNLGRTLFLAGNLHEAEKTLWQAVEVFESVRTELGQEDLQKVSFFDIYTDVNELLQQVLVAQNQSFAALEVAEQGRARSFIELLAFRLGATEPSVPSPSIQQIKKIAKEQNATLVEYSIIYDPSQTLLPARISGQQRNKESKLFIWAIKPTGEVIFREVDLKSLWQQEISEPQTSVRNYWQSYLASWGYPVTIAILIVVGGGCIFIAIRRRRLVPWSLLAVASTIGLVGLVGYNQLSQNLATRSGEQPKTALAKLVFSTHETSQKGIRGLAEIASGKTRQSQEERLQQLHQLLIEPIADLLPTELNARVIFIPQGDLFFVPFPALQDESGKHLIEKHTILTAPSIQVLELTRQQRQKLGSRESGVGSGEFMVVGNPTMPKVAPVPGEPPEPLEPLPGAEQEAKEIASLLNTQAIIGNQATEAAIVQQMPKARFIHLATHGLLDDLYNADIPGAIALAPSGEDDGLLRASEILKLKLNAELVVLSACDTGQGRITGDGVIGLSRSLFTAGVPSVIASLWKVPDEPTAFLMTNFYKNLQQQPDKAQALRQAMLTTMKKYPNPRNWAAFTLIGEAE